MERKENSLKRRVDLLESNQTYIIGKLDEIANKLKIPSYEAYAGFKSGKVKVKVEDKNYAKDISDAEVFYESNHTTIYKVPDTNKEAVCYLRMDEANYKKFRYSNDNYVKVEVIDAKTNEQVDWYNKAYVLNLNFVRQLSIGNAYFVPSEFVKVSKKKDGTKVLEKPKNEKKYESTKTVLDYDGKHILKVIMSEAAYNDFIYSDTQSIAVDLVNAYTNEKLRTKEVPVFHRNGYKTCIELYDETFNIDDFKLIKDKDSTNESTENNIRPVEAKLRPMDIERLYKEFGYDKWVKDAVMPHKDALEKYDDGKHLKELEENDPWDEDAEKSDNMYIKLANLIAWFDIDKIAHNIVKVNLHAHYDERIDTVNIYGNDAESVKNGLYDNVKELITGYIDRSKNNKLDESNNFYDMQVGRVHFIAIYVKCDEEPDESYVKYKLYWTNDECEEGEL